MSKTKDKNDRYKNNGELLTSTIANRRCDSNRRKKVEIVRAKKIPLPYWLNSHPLKQCYYFHAQELWCSVCNIEGVVAGGWGVMKEKDVIYKMAKKIVLLFWLKCIQYFKVAFCAFHFGLVHSKTWYSPMKKPTSERKTANTQKAGAKAETKLNRQQKNPQT